MSGNKFTQNIINQKLYIYSAYIWCKLWAVLAAVHIVDGVTLRRWKKCSAWRSKSLSDMASLVSMDAQAFGTGNAGVNPAAQ